MVIRIIALDPGSAKVGANVMELRDKQIHLIKSWQLPLEGKTKWERLYSLGIQLDEIVKQFLPFHSMAVEETFVTPDTRKTSGGETTYKFGIDSPLTLSMSRGVCYFVAGKYGIPVYEYNNQLCKKLLTGNANASKNMIMNAAAQKFNGVFEEDESCSLAVGNAHCLTLLQNAKKKA